MPHVLTLKIPHPLLNRLERLAGSEGRSKGSVVREAIERFLERKGEKDSAALDIRSITEAHFRGKKLKKKVDWNEIYRQARVPMEITPEEEVRRGRLRGMIFK